MTQRVTVLFIKVKTGLILRQDMFVVWDMSLMTMSYMLNWTKCGEEGN